MRPHCISSSVRSPSHRVPVNSDESSRLSVMSMTMVMLVASPRNELADVLFGPRKGGQKAQRARQRRTGVGKRIQHRADVFELANQGVFGLVGRVGGQGAEFTEPVEGFGEVVALVLEHRQRVGDGVQRLVEHRLLGGELAGEAIDALGGGDDVVLLFVDVADELFELLNQAAQVVFSAGERGAECSW